MATTEVNLNELLNVNFDGKPVKKLILDDTIIWQSPSFATDSWERINAISQKGLAQTIYNVGDEKQVILDNGVVVTLIILGFNHDDLSDNSGKSKITIGLKSSYSANRYIMNNENTNSGGWEQCLVRTIDLPDIYNQLPSDLQNIIKNVNKYTSDGNLSTNISASVDKLFLLSEIEIYGNTNHSVVGEGSQYEYYSQFADYEFKPNNYCWLRSPSKTTNTDFVLMSRAGGTVTGQARTYQYIIFAFCI